MSTECNAKAEAEAEVSRLNSATIDIFCPLSSQNFCNDKCPCYQAAYTKSEPHSSEDVWYVYKACCNNAMFFNTCQYGC